MPSTTGTALRTAANPFSNILFDVADLNERKVKSVDEAKKEVVIQENERS